MVGEGVRNIGEDRRAVQVRAGTPAQPGWLGGVPSEEEEAGDSSISDRIIITWETSWIQEEGTMAETTYSSTYIFVSYITNLNMGPIAVLHCQNTASGSDKSMDGEQGITVHEDTAPAL